MDRSYDRRKKRIKKLRKRNKYLKILSLIFMANITIGCIFITDYNMNKMLNKKSIISNNINLIQKNINFIKKYLKNIDLKIEI